MIFIIMICVVLIALFVVPAEVLWGLLKIALVGGAIITVVAVVALVVAAT